MKKKKLTALSYLYSILGTTKWQILSLVLVQAILGGITVGYALVLREIINYAVAGAAQPFFISLAVFVSLVCGQLLLRTLNQFLEELSRSTLENRFKERLFSTLLQKEYSAVSAVHSGEWLNRLTSDTVVVSKGLTEILPGATGMAVKLIGAVILLIILEPKFLYLLIPGGLLLIALSYAFRQISKRLHKKVQEQDGKLRIFLTESLGSLLVWRSFARENYAQQEAQAKMQAHQAARMQKNRFSNLGNLGFGIMMNGAYVLGVGFCGYGILTGSMSYGNFIAVLQLIGQVQSPFANISGFLPQYYALLASAERLIEVNQLPDPPQVQSHSLDWVRKSYESDLESFGLAKASFTYLPPIYALGQVVEETPRPLILKELSLEIKKGEYVAFTGTSGCGKSTVLKLLLCLYPLDSGERYLVSKGRRQSLDAGWQKLFAYVPQGNYLLSGTIRELVAFSDQTQIQDEIRLWQALAIACADGFVSELEMGLDTQLGERGLGLSEGQIQRLAIARAVFSEHPILMLDESTSALDVETEKQVLQNLRNMTNKTVLIVTHRPAALEICDQIVYFDETGLKITRKS